MLELAIVGNDDTSVVGLEGDDAGDDADDDLESGHHRHYSLILW